MRILVRTCLVATALAALSGAALAQETASPAPQPQVTSARAQCKAQIDSRSLTGPERKAAMRDCMKPQRDACRSQAVAKALPKGPERKAFMHECLHGAVAAAH